MADAYVCLRGAADPAMVGAVYALAVEACRPFGWLGAEGRLTGTGYDDPRWVQVQQALLPTPEMEALRSAPSVLEALEIVCGTPVRAARADIVRVALPAQPELTTPPHQDHHYVGGAPDLWVAWWPLHDLSEAHGPLAVWPGSAARGPLPHSDGGVGVNIADDAWVSGALRAGDVVLFHCLTVHRALPNRSEHARLSADFRYRPRV